MKKYRKIILWISVLCFLFFGFWTWFYYMAIHSDIPIQYTIEEWNMHLDNIKTLRFLGFAMIICFLTAFKVTKTNK